MPFDSEGFLHWLEGKEGPIRGDVLDREWPEFPRHRLVGVTMRVADDGTPLIPQRDLRDVVVHGVPLD